MISLEGELTVRKTLKCVLKPEAGDVIKGYLNGEINASLEPLPHKPLEYEDSYEVDPLKVRQVLSTRDKVMTSDLVINGIYYYEVTNNSGGKTVTIGKD